MSTLTLRLADEKHARLRELAALQGVSMNHLIDQLTTAALAQHATEQRFRRRANAGSVQKGLKVLAKLDRHFSS